MQQAGEVIQRLRIRAGAIGAFPGAAEQFLGVELVEPEQRRLLFVAALVLAGDAHQTASLAQQGALDLLAQVWLRLIQHDADLQPGPLFVQQVGLGQFADSIERLAKRRGADAQQFHRAWHRKTLYILQALTFQGDEEDLVAIVHFGEGQRQRRAAIANALLSGDFLWLMQMTEGYVGDLLRKQAGGQRFDVADDQVSLGVFGNRAAGHVCVADGDQCLSRRATGVRGGNQAFVHLADTGQVIVAEPASGDFGGTQEGQGQAPGGDLAIRVVQGQQQAIAIEAFVYPADPADGMGVQSFHQRSGQFDARAGVVVACDHHDLQPRQPSMGADDEVVEALLGFERWIDRVEDIARDQQDIGALLFQLAQQPVEEARMLMIAVLAVQGLAQVPVGGMYEAHGTLVESGGAVARIPYMRQQKERAGQASL